MFRLAALCVSLAALLVSTLYSSAIVSHLTRPPMLIQPQTIMDLVKRDLFWSLSYNTAHPSNLLHMEVFIGSEYIKQYLINLFQSKR